MKLTDAEWQIMNALWREHPATAREIQELLPSEVEWAYTTLKTMLSRLVEKKAIKERKADNTSVYEPILTCRKARHGALRNLAEQAFDGAFGQLVHFLIEERNLNAAQRRELLNTLQKSLGEDGHDRNDQ